MKDKKLIHVTVSGEKGLNCSYYGNPAFAATMTGTDEDGNTISLWGRTGSNCQIGYCLGVKHFEYIMYHYTRTGNVIFTGGKEKK